jgi:hypothetical protein
LPDWLGLHQSTIFRWILLGLDISSEQSIRQFLESKNRRRNSIRKPITESVETDSKLVDEATPDADLSLIELAP